MGNADGARCYKTWSLEDGCGSAQAFVPLHNELQKHFDSYRETDHYTEHLEVVSDVAGGWVPRA